MGHDVDYWTVLNVLPLDALTPSERELLGRGELDQELVVYECNDHEGAVRRVVAPSDQSIGSGSHVRAGGQRAWVSSSVTVGEGQTSSSQINRVPWLELADEVD